MNERDLLRALASLYEGAGFREYKMRKFEEYSLYLENRDFLSSEYVITFSDLSGRLLALKPDVTLSIVKGSLATRERSEKLYYCESVYRLDARTQEYREIRQMGLEALGEIDRVQTLEVASLAVDSLAAISDMAVMDFSHMGYLGSALKGVNGAAKTSILSALSSKNAGALAAALSNADISGSRAERIMALSALSGDFCEGLSVLKKYADDDEMQNAVDELSILGAGLTNPRVGIRLDFSISGNLKYYTGVLFCGYVRTSHRAVLSGGRYDGLTDKLKLGVGALGFAVYLNDIRLADANADGSEVLLTYKDDSDAVRVIERAANMRRNGMRVRIEPYKCDKSGYAAVAEVD